MLARVPFWASPFWEHSAIRRYVRYASLAVDRLIAAHCLNDPCKAKAVTLACGTNFDFKIARRSTVWIEIVLDLSLLPGDRGRGSLAVNKVDALRQAGKPKAYR